MILEDKVAVVTGASSGIGLAFVRRLAARGVRVYGLARSIERMHEIREEVGAGFVPIRCDVREASDVKRSFEQVLEDAGRVDVLINNAGLGRYAEVADLSIEDWDVQMETNARGVFLCTRAVIPPMRQQNEATGFGGYIINIASIAGLLGNPNLSAYNASKFAVRGFSEALMKEVRDYGIKVTCIYPGSVETSFTTRPEGSGSTHKMLPDDLASTVIHLLETRDNYLISEIVMRPLRPRG